MSPLRTALYDLNVELGGKMVPFAGYEMPVQFPLGVMKEHVACRSGAGLFDVSHMGQIVVTHPDGLDAAAAALERLVPQNVIGLAVGRQRYGLFLGDNGGILDDLMIARRAGDLFLVVNAACKDSDLALLQKGLPECDVKMLDRALLALQGPLAESVLDSVASGAAEMSFMDVATLGSDYGDLWVSRSGYTGEDGYEISVDAAQAEAFARRVLQADGVVPVGLGARDSLRLEAGLCLYGNDIDIHTSPIEANLVWAIQKVRRTGGARAGGFPGAERVLAELDGAPTRLRVGLKPEGRAPMRDGVELFAEDRAVGRITSGGFGPSVEHPIAMGYVDIDHAAIGTKLQGELRGRRLPVEVVDLPFRPATYKR
ncbi:Aminomethyltransferase [Rhodobacteraceae bacterium THAF1]|uniref:glycine cleavage system aminomethyltransferase GcvT n=1 Tax=Palleronia sp. THAF1 TaxID=2587842 RepID=UPI000F402548|nr:glycine cleavage system aminomethyltransferase GcvT [Palleronia sp. THAF1]QFU09498.1 Aminomethyltransferase [Palleronia sp. THAF1]VDC21821.1 Aminomethyltransferase [Rhodobacteraceae bacterium THAF1]